MANGSGISIKEPMKKELIRRFKNRRIFKSLGLPTRLGDAGIGEETILEIQKRFTQRQVAFGEDQDVTAEVAGQILENCK